jgi:hypothetical protein
MSFRDAQIAYDQMEDEDYEYVDEEEEEEE